MSDGILVFVIYLSCHDKLITDTLLQAGLFAAVVATFLVQSYTLLSPDPGYQTAMMLGKIIDILQQNQTASNASPSPNIVPGPTGSSSYAVQLNTLWSLSLVLTLFSAFMATLLQQWIRRYLSTMHGPGSVRDRALLHASLLGGVEQFAMRYSVDVVVLSLHSAVALFIYGLIVCLNDKSPDVAWAVKAFACFFLAVYIILTVMPIMFPSCPYATP
ncbi:hypothetical protein PENSPDRAFT_583307, partial [Peniophora sp. CONT]